MTEFRYRAARADGRIVTGTVTAPSGEQVDTILLTMGLQPLESGAAPTFRLRTSQPSPRDLAIVFRSLTSLVGAGVSLVRAVMVSENLTRNPVLKQALEETRRLLIEGKSLTESLEHTRVAPGIVLGMLRAGERGSNLAPALEQAASHLEEEAEMAGRLRQALAYPFVLLVAGFVSVAVITVVVVPRFAAILSDLGQGLPASTRTLLMLSTTIRNHGLLLFLIGVGLVAAFSTWISTPAGKQRFHAFLLRVPIIGTLRLGFSTARVTRALGGLLATGFPMINALSAAREAAGDAEIAARIDGVAQRISRGERIATAVNEERALSPVAIQLVAVGESSGQLPRMLDRAGLIAGQEAEGAMRALVSLLEPALVVVFGGIVAFTAIALLQAVYSLRPG